MVVVFPGQQPMTSHQISLYKACGHNIYLSEEDDIYDMHEVPIVIAHNGIHHYSPTTIILKRD